MKKIILSLIFSFAALSGCLAATPQQTDMKFYDVRQYAFPLANHGFDDAVGYYGRLSSSLEGKVRDMVWYLAQNNAGVAVRFRSTEGTVDGGHLTDLGFQQIADFLYPIFRNLP